MPDTQHPSVAPDPAHCYVCERIAWRPESLTLNDLDTLVRGGLLGGDQHVSRVANDELLRRLAARQSASSSEVRDA
jgi:hypothetical protein